MNDYLETPAVLSHNSDREFDAAEQEDASALRWLIETEYFDEND